MDAWEEVLVEEVLAQRGVRYAVRNAQIGQYRGRMIFTSHGPVPVTLFNSASTRGGWINRGRDRGLPQRMRDLPPQEPAGPGLDLRRRPGFRARSTSWSRRLGIPILFALHNFGYRDAAFFAAIDYAIVPTEFARRFYRETIGLNCQRVAAGDGCRSGCG